MSKAVYAKLWMATSQYHLRRQYGWMQVWKRLAPWSVLYGAVGLWMFFPALSYDAKKKVTFGLWSPPDVGYYKFQVKPEE
ncbi:hypothetical protein BEWA_032020 [Theileria equi strain WA]|uniref:Uncharacterized protein n=1 Tax=Theileria equi strain WA TaxID=1537102 RepID=L0AZN1_THEEQ|nr:hypothetical protein BEWA_032020 [Theileria equi strain WA]AFZ80349.1 hypothetical protein BEWA_032020 [Theileria equi strain WA]|eukprot:XP_004830015.1 hypothetical protein BEWA_032020 [Theileria equi strain WA]